MNASLEHKSRDVGASDLSRRSRFTGAMATRNGSKCWTFTREDDTLWVRFRGIFHASDVDAFFNDLVSDVPTTDRLCYFVGDTTAVTAVDADIHVPSQRVLRHLKRVGVRHFLIISPSPVLAMIVRTTTFVTGLRCTCLPDITAARQFLTNQHSRAAKRRATG